MGQANDEYPPHWSGRERRLYDYGPDVDEPLDYDWRGDEFWEWPGP